MGVFFATHPRASTENLPRSAVSLSLLFVWSVRLTHSYFRREDWKFGQREDWRYTKMAKENPKMWWLFSFFAVGLAQQPMLVGIALPSYSVALSPLAAKPFDVVDGIAVAGAALGLLTAFVADNQLRHFMQRNEELVKAGQPKVPLLDAGLWRWSRHPNYFGEQLWWWSFGIFAVNVGQWYMLWGALFNSLVLASVTVMTETRMLKNWPPERVKLYRAYMRRTGPCVPGPRWPFWGMCGSRGGDDDNE